MSKAISVFDIAQSMVHTTGGFMGKMGASRWGLASPHRTYTMFSERF